MQANLNVSLLKAALKCASKKDVRYYLNGVCLDFINPEEMIYIGADGSVLFCAMDKVDGDFAGQIILPRVELEKALKGYKQPAIYLTSVDGGKYLLGDTILTAVDCKFPDYSRIIPQTVSNETAQYNPALLDQAAKALLEAGYKFPALHYNGTSAVMVGDKNALCVIMAWRVEPSAYTGFEFPQAVKTEAVAA